MPAIDHQFLPNFCLSIQLDKPADCSDLSEENCFHIVSAALTPLEQHCKERGFQSLRIPDADIEKRTLNPYQDCSLEVQLPTGEWRSMGTITPCNEENKLKGPDDIALEMLQLLMTFIYTDLFTEEKKQRATELSEQLSVEDGSWADICTAYSNAMKALEDPMDLGMFSHKLKTNFTLLFTAQLGTAAANETLGENVDGFDYLDVCSIILESIIPDILKQPLDNPLAIIVNVTMMEQIWLPMLEFLKQEGQARFREILETDIQPRINALEKEWEEIKKQHGIELSAE